MASTDSDNDLTSVGSNFNFCDLLPLYFEDRGGVDAGGPGAKEVQADFDALATYDLVKALEALGDGGAAQEGGHEPPNKRRCFSWFDDRGELNKPSGLWEELKASPSCPLARSSPSGSAPCDKPTGSCPPERPRKRRGKASSKQRKRKGVATYRPDVPQAKFKEARLAKLMLRALRQGQLLKNNGTQMVSLPSCSSSGWQGKPPPLGARDEIKQAWLNGSLDLSNLYPVYYWTPPEVKLEVPAVLFDESIRVFAYRTTRLTWLADLAEDFHQAISLLLNRDLTSAVVERRHKGGPRGDHLPCIIGHDRQNKKKPALTAWHRENAAAVEEFLQSPVIDRITKCVSSVVAQVFPGVARRFEESASWHKEHYGIEPLFGLFWNFCVNATFPGQSRIHCSPHADSKNQVGVCVLVVYATPGALFNHTKRSWLVIWEAGVAIELPPWTMLVYPSSLFFHFNIDVQDIKFVTTKNEARPTPANSQPMREGDEAGRGSLVYFNQATMYQSSETGFSTLKEARQRGHTSCTDFGTDAQLAFTSYAQYFSLDSELEAQTTGE